MIKYVAMVSIIALLVISAGCNKKIAVTIGCDIEKAEVIINNEPKAVIQNEKAELMMAPGAYDIVIKTISYGEKNLKVEVKKESTNEFSVYFLGTLCIKGLEKGNEISMGTEKLAVIDDTNTVYTSKMEPGNYTITVKTKKGKKDIAVEVKAGEITESTL